MEDLDILIDSYIESIKKWYYEWIISYSNVDKYLNINFVDKIITNMHNIYIYLLIFTYNIINYLQLYK